MATSKSILLIGESSFDIQITANELAGETVFPQPGSTMEFKVKKTKKFAVDGQPITLTVAPGFIDNRPDMTPKQMASIIGRKLQNHGFHRVVVVMSYPLRWTDEERRTTQFTVNVIGNANLKQYGTLILTNGYNFQTKYPENTVQQYREYLDHQASQGVELGNFLNLFRGHALLLDAEMEDQGLNGPQLEQLFNSLGSGRFKIEQPERVSCHLL